MLRSRRSQRDGGGLPPGSLRVPARGAAWRRQRRARVKRPSASRAEKPVLPEPPWWSEVGPSQQKASHGGDIIPLLGQGAQRRHVLFWRLNARSNAEPV